MSNTPLTPQQLFAFYQQVEKLKTTLRHSWLSDGIRQESVAEHSWMMSLLAMVLMPKVDQQLDQLKVLKMIVVHDLAEAITTDLPVWEGQLDKTAKFEAEKAAITKIFSHLDKPLADELFAIWMEYEQRQSPEAVFVKMIDTLDVITQHNVAPISTWDDNDFWWQLSPLQDRFFDHDIFVRQLKDALDSWSITKATQAGQQDKLDQEQLQRRMAKKPKNDDHHFSQQSSQTPPPKLVLPAARYKASYIEAAAEFQQENNPRASNYLTLDLAALAQDFDSYVQRLLNYSKGIDLPAGFVPSTEFWLIDAAETYLGRVDIRHELNDFLLSFGGHIGYNIRQSQRGKGYGTLALQLGLEKARELGLEKVLITCDLENLPSLKVIEKNGGVFANQLTQDGKVTCRYWVELQVTNKL